MDKNQPDELNKQTAPDSSAEDDLLPIFSSRKTKEIHLPEDPEQDAKTGLAEASAEPQKKKRASKSRRAAEKKTESAASEDGKIAAEDARRPGKRKTGRVILLVAVLLAAVMTALVLLFPELFDLDRMIRFFRYAGLRNKDGYGRITYEASTNNVYGGFDGCLALGNESGLTLFDLEGNQKAMIQTTLSEPLLSRGDKICLIYSPGTGCLAAFGKGGKILLNQTVPGSVLDADVSNDGYICYLGSESGYKSTATMLTPKQETQFRLTSRTRYLNVCSVSDGGKYLAVASLGAKDSVFCSEVTILRTKDKLDDLDSEDSTAVRVDLGNQVIYDLNFLPGGSLCAVGQKTVTLLSTEGEILRQINLESNPLVSCDFSSKDFVVILQRMGIAGEGYRITTLDGSGEELGVKELNERVRSVSASGRYVAVLTDSEAVVYRRNLKRYAYTKDIGPATSVIARPDGSALLVSGTEAVLFLP